MRSALPCLALLFVLAAAPNHSPRFFVDESGLLQGTRSLAALTMDFLMQKP